MTKDQKIIRAKAGLLELAKQLGNVSQACKIMGYSRDSFYRFKDLYDKGGELALQEMSRRKPILKNRVAPEIEAAVVAMAIDQPAWGTDADVERTGQARDIHLALRRSFRLAAPRPADHEAPAQGARGQDGAQDGLILTEAQVATPEKAKAMTRRPTANSSPNARDIAAPRTPSMSGCSRASDASTSRPTSTPTAKVGFAKLYDRRKTPLTAADLLNDRVIPFYEENGIPLQRVLTDRGTELRNPMTATNTSSIWRSRTSTIPEPAGQEPVDHPGIVERFHKTMLDEFYRIAFRKKIYTSIEDLQGRDLDLWMREFNEARPHQGKWCFGKTPMQTFLDALPLAREKSLQVTAGEQSTAP